MEKKKTFVGKVLPSALKVLGVTAAMGAGAMLAPEGAELIGAGFGAMAGAGLVTYANFYNSIDITDYKENKPDDYKITF